MATTTHYFTGPCRWAKVYKPDEKYEKYSIEVKLNEKDIKVFEALGLKNRPSRDGEGYYSFRRDPKAIVFAGSARVEAGAPTVIGADDKPTRELIGNGSIVTIKIQVYDYDNKFGKGKGSRLDAVKVDNLEKYEKPQVAAAGNPEVPAASVPSSDRKRMF